MFNTTTRAPLHTNKLDGFLDEILQYMLKDIGYRLETVELPAERGLVYTNSGKVDGEMSRVEGMQKRYQNLIPVPEKCVLDAAIPFFLNLIKKSFILGICFSLYFLLISCIS